MKMKINWDGVGIITSIVCAIHCGLLPLLLPALPLLGINTVHNGIFEWSMIGIAFCVGCYALYHGFIKHHHRYKPVILFLSGFVLLICKQIFSDYQNIFLLVAVPLIISAHYINYQLCTRNKCHSPHHKH
jgi:hypothetical protein